LANTLK